MSLFSNASEDDVRKSFDEWCEKNHIRRELMTLSDLARFKDYLFGCGLRNDEINRCLDIIVQYI